MTDEEYNALTDTHPRPYIVEFENQNGGALLLYGGEHTLNPDDPQIIDIQTRWDSFRPTVALMESRLGFFVQGFQNPVETYGEMGWAFSLARKDYIPVYTWEAPCFTPLIIRHSRHFTFISVMNHSHCFIFHLIRFSEELLTN